ncbi:DUF1150 family protein [Bradyrhizobium liaoningense]|uniref:DUF1150 family protein n=1 Tax=Bradyrhizobium liaoningense TaxID=43992 RepID=UPI003D9A802A
MQSFPGHQFLQCPPSSNSLHMAALIMLTDSREAAVANARSKELQAVSVHRR